MYFPFLTVLYKSKKYLNILVANGSISLSLSFNVVPEMPQNLESVGMQLFLELQWSPPIGVYDGYRITYTLDGTRTVIPDLPSQPPRYTLRVNTLALLLLVLPLLFFFFSSFSCIFLLYLFTFISFSTLRYETQCV